MITGGASGIGRAAASRLTQEGARVAVLDQNVVDRSEEEAEQLSSIRSYRCDVSDAGSVRQALAAVREELGPPAIAVHCAAYQHMVPFDQVSDELWTRTLRVNVDGGFHLAQAVLPEMRRAGWGRIVMVASSTFFAPPPGMTHYIASKGALIGMVRGLAAEVGSEGITVNALAPGLTKTATAVARLPEEQFAAIRARQAVKRSGLPDDQAGALSFLVSDDAAFISGQTLLVDGGEGHV